MKNSSIMPGINSDISSISPKGGSLGNNMERFVGKMNDEIIEIHSLVNYLLCQVKRIPDLENNLVNINNMSDPSFYLTEEYLPYYDGSKLADSPLHYDGTTLALDACNDAGTDTNKFLVLDSSSNIDYRTGAELLADLSGDAAGAFSWNSQNLTNVATLTAVNVNITSLTSGYLPYYTGTILDDSVIYHDGTNIGISTTSPLATFDVCGRTSIIFGSDSGGSTRTNSEIKIGRIGSVHYNTEEESACVAYTYNGSTYNRLFIGGGTSVLNAATDIIFYTAADNATTTGTECARFTSGQKFGIGVISPLGKIDIAFGGMTMFLGADSNATTRTDDTDKYSRMGMIQYDVDEEGSCLLYGYNNTNGNNVNIGGGTNTLNAATKISFYTAATLAVLTGTECLRIDNNGTLISYFGRIKQTTRITNSDSPYTALVTDEIIYADTDIDVITINLPAGVEGTHYKITNVGTHGNDVTVDGNASQTVRGNLTLAITDGNEADLHYNATEGWW